MNDRANSTLLEGLAEAALIVRGRRVIAANAAARGLLGEDVAGRAVDSAILHPSSSSYALVGGLVGAGAAKAGFGAIVASGVTKTAVFIFAAPLLGMAAAC